MQTNVTTVKPKTKYLSNVAFKIFVNLSIQSDHAECHSVALDVNYIVVFQPVSTVTMTSGVCVPRDEEGKWVGEEWLQVLKRKKENVCGGGEKLV